MRRFARELGARASATEVFKAVQRDADASEASLSYFKPAAVPAFNREMAARMLKALNTPYIEADDMGQFEITAIFADREANERPIAKHFRLGDLHSALDAAAAWNSQEGWNLYVGAALRTDAPLYWRATDLHVAGTRWLWVDFDDPGAAEAGLRRMAEVGLKPSFSVQTGVQPHLRLQCWFRFNGLLPRPEIGKRLKVLAKALDSDRNVTNPSRVMRLAGSIAWPKPHKPGRVIEMVILRAGDDAEL